MRCGDRDVGGVVGAQRLDAFAVVEEDERGEVGQLEPVAEDQRRLHAAVGDESPAGELRE